MKYIIMFGDGFSLMWNILIIYIHYLVLKYLVKSFIERYDKMLRGHAQLFIISFIIFVVICILASNRNWKKE